MALSILHRSVKVVQQWILLLCGLFLIAACDSNNGSQPNVELVCRGGDIKSLQITPDTWTTLGSTQIVLLAPGNSQPLTAVAAPTGSGETEEVTQKVNWVSSNPSLISVDQNGIVTAHEPNASVTVYACFFGVKSNSTQVNSSNAKLDSIQLAPASLTLPKGVTRTLTAEGSYSDATSANISSRVTWESSDPDSVTVSTNGDLTAIRPAMGVTIKASLDGITSNTVTVSVTDAELEQLVITPPRATLAAGNTQQLTATGIYSDDSFQDLSSQVNWVSSVPNALSISQTGELTANSVTSNALVFASLANVTSNTVSVSVMSASLTAIQVSPDSFVLAKGHQQQLSAIGIYSNNTTADISDRISWVSDNASAVTVNQSGMVTAVDTATDITITASLGSVKAIPIMVDVTDASLESIHVTPAMLSLAQGQEGTLEAVGYFSDDTSIDISNLVAWQSSDVDKATVTRAGIVKAEDVISDLAVYARLDGIQSNTVEVTITPAVLQDIQITPATASIAKGQDVTLTATGIYSDDSSVDLTQSVTWKSSSVTSVVVSAQGIASGIATTSGATVSATLNGITSNNATIAVTEAVLQQIQVTPTSALLPDGTTAQLTATGVYSDNTTADLTNTVSWITPDASAITVSTGGLVTGIAQTATKNVTASDNGLTSNPVAITVIPATLTAIQITPPLATITIGLTQSFTASGTYSDGTVANISDEVSWVSANINEVSINANGIAQGLSQTDGSMIIANYKGLRSNVATVTVKPAELDYVRITPSTETLPKGVALQLTAVGVFTDTSVIDLTSEATWVSSNDNDVSVSPSGLINGEAVSTGTQVTATYNGTPSNVTTVNVTEAILKSIQITPGAVNLPKGTQQTMQAIGYYSDFSTADLTDSVAWKSSNTANVVVGANGAVSGINVSTGTTLTASLGSITSNAAIVNVDQATLDTIQITPANATLAKGLTTQLTATGIFSDKTTKDLTDAVNWISSNTESLTVSSTGLVTGVNVSTGTRISATYNAVSSNTASIDVTEASLTALQVTPALISLAKGQEQALTVTATYSDNSTVIISEPVAWSVSNLSAVFVSPSGVLEGLEVASGVTVSASIGGVTSNTVQVTVDSAILDALNISPLEADIPLGFTQQMRAYGTLSDGTLYDVTEYVTWQSNNTAALTVSKKGIAQAVAEANDIGVTAYLGEKASNQALLSVLPPSLLSITVTIVNDAEPPQTATNLAIGRTLQLSATANYSDGSEIPLSNVDWISANPAAATVSNNGLVTAVSTATDVGITASLDSETSAPFLITVTSAVINSISVSPSTVNFFVNGIQPLTAIAQLSDGSSKDVTTQANWKSANTANVTVSKDGILSGVQISNNTLVNASLDGITSNDVTVTVIEPATRIPVCGGVLDDTSTTNASGFCLKVTADYRGNWFTSSPSLTVLQNIQFIEISGSTDGDYTYSSTTTDSGRGASFGLFSQQNGTVVGNNGQADNWCDYLSSVKFAGQQNWQLPTSSRLKYFNKLFYDELESYYGWPVDEPYWTSTASSSGYKASNLSIFNNSSTQSASNELYVTCMSPP